MPRKAKSAAKSDPVPPGPLGHIPPDSRTAEQEDAHARTLLRVPRLTLRAPDFPSGAKFILTEYWKHPDVMTDVGRAYIRELQNTGSCVKVGGTNALRCSIAAQRVAGMTKAFEPFTWANYAASRHAFGDDGEGEGSMGSTFAASLHDDGCEPWPQDAADQLPDYRQVGEHIEISGREELTWSSYRSATVRAVLDKTRADPMGKLGTAAELREPADILGMVLNGYGVSFACNNFIGNASVQGSGDAAAVVGYWNGSGGHQQWVFGAWRHPSLGMLYAVGNNWPDDTYPRDPAGLPSCTCWVTEAKVAAAFRLDAEVYGLSHLNWFPANADKLLHHFI